MTTDRQQHVDERTAESDGMMLERLAESVGKQATPAAVYGPAVTQDGVTVVPVAKLRWGFGGGWGHTQAEAQTSAGGGGGGGVMASPVGYIELAQGTTRFRRVNDLGTLPFLVPVILAGGLTARLILGSIRRVLWG